MKRRATAAQDAALYAASALVALVVPLPADAFLRDGPSVWGQWSQGRRLFVVDEDCLA